MRALHFSVPAPRCALLPLCAVLTIGLAACGDTSKLPPGADVGAAPTLPEPVKSLIPTVNIAPAQGWPEGVIPQPMAGMTVTALASGLDHPRWVYTLPNGDVLVAESNKPPKPDAAFSIKGWIMGKVMKRAGAGVPSANRITLLRDVDGDGKAEIRTVFMQGLFSPFGMALVGKELFIANADALVKVPYEEGQTTISATPVKVVDLPAGINHHWTKNVIASRDGSKLYVTVGSNSNVGENGMAVEVDRAAVHEVDPKAGTRRLFASGLRNPNGMGWAADGTLWTVVNERDEIGSDLVPDYLTSVRDGAFYGWPYSYYGQNVDVRVTPPRPDLVAKAVSPDYALGSHVAPLGMAFAEGNSLPPSLGSGVFVGLHGSWNRKPLSGYKVVFVPFAGSKPVGKPLDVLTGFLSPDGKAYGRPVGVTIDKRGALLVADDVGNVIWRVAGAPVRP
ncbi:MAG: sorbosone dehydrogenase family protein [Polaromonas sp.]|uniref:PQQ-dependent sugar dehydrogenase n=1 Tax=Polaromonas sp. TaxID=1869339 RepID=UPI001855A752|nr:sorbosone dehydrogenase family protein [Polaromonas sp.]MBA3593049.1 sorbosone dehydrogenase family protein [Polaromonas sp.]